MRVGKKRIPLKALHTFEATGRHLSMKLAADELAVTQSAVSHQIRHLEEQLGHSLFDRSRKQLRLTSRGGRLLSVVSRALEEIKLETLSLDGETFAGQLTIAATPTFTTLWLVPRLPELLERFPELEIHLKMMQVPAPSVLPEADLVVQFGKHHWPRKRVLPLVETDYVPVCAPQRLKGIRRLQPEILSQQILIHEDHGEAWARWLAAAGVDNLQPKRHIYVDNAMDALELSRLGVGFAITDHIITSNWVAKGDLLQPFAQTVKGYDSYYLLTDPEEQLSGLTREVEIWLRQNIESEI